MKYKVGQKVRIKKSRYDFGHKPFLEKYNYILTIKDLDGSFYFMEEDSSFWYSEPVIEGLYVEEFNPIESRFEILDIR